MTEPPAARLSGQPDPETVKASIDALSASVERMSAELRALRQSATVMLGIIGIVLSVVITDPPDPASFASPELSWVLLVVAGFGAGVTLIESLEILLEVQGVSADLGSISDTAEPPDVFRVRLMAHLRAAQESIVESVLRTQTRLRRAAIAAVVAGGAFGLAIGARDVALPFK
jgi:hypothetical protein